MSGQHNQQARQQHQQQYHQYHRKQRRQAADRRSQIAVRAENCQQLDDDQTADEEDEFTHNANDQVDQQQHHSRREVIPTGTGTVSLDERDQARSKSGSDPSVALSEQVITSLQVNSKKEVEPFIKKEASALATSASATVTSQNQTVSAEAAKNGLKKQTFQGRHDAAKHILDPSGELYYHWSMVVSFAFLYNFWSLSYRFAFREIDFDTVAFWFALDYSADIIYILDLVINSRTGYLEDGVLQRNKDKISNHYRECTLFYLDCFCLLPLDILYLSIGFNSILRCTRLIKIYKFWSYVDRTERHTNYPNVFRTFTLVHYILVIFHWNACLFHMISKSKIIDIEDLYKINDNRCSDVLCQYLHAFYWSTLALTTIGDLPRPRTKGEYLFVIVELFFGLFLFASVLGHVANIVTNVSAARKEFQAKLDAVKTFMRMRRVSDELQSKVIRWFDYLWISQKSSDEERSVACLPDRLKAEIAIHVHLDTLKRVDIFQNTEAGFLCELVLRLKPVLFSPDDYVCRKNEVGHEMYIVSRGILEVVTDEGKTVVATLKAGSYFGEISVLNVGLAGNKRTASVRSVGYSDLFCLNKQDLWDVLKNYPNAEARIRARAEDRLNKLDINHSRTSGMQTSNKMGSSSKSSKLKNICDLGTTGINGITRASGHRKQRNIARCNLINRHNKKHCHVCHQSNQNPYRSDLFDEEVDANHLRCCLSNQTSLRYKPAYDNKMMSILNKQGFCNKALSTSSSSQGSLSDVLVGCSDDQNKQHSLQIDNSNLIKVESIDELRNFNGNKEINRTNDNVNSSSGNGSQIIQNHKVKQRQQNYPTSISERINRNIPSRLLSGSISSELEMRDRNRDRRHKLCTKLCRQDQIIACERNVKCCQHQYSLDDSYSSIRAMDARRYLRQRTGDKPIQLVRQSQSHHSHHHGEQDLGHANETMATLYSGEQPMVAPNSTIMAEQRPSLWLPNQLPIYATSRVATMPKQCQDGTTSSGTVGPIIQVPMLATPVQDGRFQYLQPIIANNNNNPLSVSMSNLDIGSSLNLHGHVAPRSANQLEGQYLFVNQKTVEDRSTQPMSSQSIQIAQINQQQQKTTHEPQMRNQPQQRRGEFSNPRQTASIDNSLGGEMNAITGAGNLKLEGYSHNRPTNDAHDTEQQFRIEMSEPINDGTTRVSESRQSCDDLSELPLKTPSKEI